MCSGSEDGGEHHFCRTVARNRVSFSSLRNTFSSTVNISKCLVVLINKRFLTVEHVKLELDTSITRTVENIIVSPTFLRLFSPVLGLGSFAGTTFEGASPPRPPYSSLHMAERETAIDPHLLSRSDVLSLTFNKQSSSST
jgi:hypothetical protein